MRFILCVFFIAVAACMKSGAQLLFNFVPEVYARTIDGLSSFQVHNASTTKFIGQISIQVTDKNTRQPVVSILTGSATFNPGMNSMPKSAYMSSVFHFSATKTGRLVNQTRTFPPGEYSFCFSFLPADKSLTDNFENCFESFVQPLVPVSLIYPGDKDTICQKRPVLNWQPPLPLQPGMKYRLMLVEKGERAAVEAMLKRAPLLLLDNITSTTINYPFSHPELVEGKTYSWQVGAYTDGLLVSTSEIWEFTVQCKDPVMPDPGGSYRELKLIANGNYYYANRFLRFSFLNNYGPTVLRYSILDIKNGLKEITDLPKVAIKPGRNNIDIDLTDIGLKDGAEYLLRVYPFNEEPVQVRFIYKETSEEE